MILVVLSLVCVYLQVRWYQQQKYQHAIKEIARIAFEEHDENIFLDKTALFVLQVGHAKGLRLTMVPSLEVVKEAGTVTQNPVFFPVGEWGLLEISGGPFNHDFMEFYAQKIGLTFNRYQSAKYYSFLADSINGIVIIFDTEKQIKYVSPGITQFETFSLDLFHEEDAFEWEKGIYECRLQTFEGLRWFEIRLHQIENGWRMALRDIHDEVQMQQRLENSEARLNGIITSAMDAIIAVDPDKTILLFNPAAEMMFRCRQDEAIGSSLFRFFKNLDLNETIVEATTATRADNTEFPVEVSGNYFDSNDLTYFTLIIRDTTEKSQVSEIKQNLISMTAHEIRTPLTAIKGYSQLIRNTQSLDSAYEYGEHIEQEANQLTILSEGLMQTDESMFSRLSPTTFDLRELVQEQFRRMQMVNREDRMILSLPEAPIMGTWDYSRIGGVITNLIENALKYSDKDVTVSVFYQNEEGCVSVADKGIGISNVERQQICKPYYRSPRSQHYQSQGIGLGLFVVQKTLEMHNGELVVDSVVGKGTTMTVKLPLNMVLVPIKER